MEKQERDIDFFIHKRALLLSDDECGDSGIVKLYNNTCFIALIDALGHGRNAHKVASSAEDYLNANYQNDLTSLMTGLHNCLKETRGAVASICKLHIPSGRLQFVGMGNVTTRILGRNNIRLVSSDGVIGYIISKPKEQSLEITSNDVLILHSDGISEHFNFENFSSLFTMSAREIAINIMDRYGKDNDDKSCVVLKYTG